MPVAFEENATVSNSMTINTPVVVCVFNRPRHTLELMRALAGPAPSHLMVIADGPRADRIDDPKKCDAALQIVRQNIVWPCAVAWNISKTNLGCRKRIQSGLNWVFSQVDSAIILEDDCIPDPTFFQYCENLLDAYRDRPEVGIVSGSNPLAIDDQNSFFANDESYLFSRYPIIWGWATWRRVWQNYDPDIAEWQTLRQTDWLSTVLADPLAVSYWRAIFNRVLDGFDAWDYSLNYSLWRHDALTIIPRVNMIRNIGFGPEAIHTRFHDSRADQKSSPPDMPLLHPLGILRSSAFDAAYERTWCSGTSEQLLERLRASIRVKGS
jgi:hypothetical protein